MVKVISLIALGASLVAGYVYNTNYAATGWWLDWNPDYGFGVNLAVNMMIAAGCVVTAWAAIAFVDRVVEKCAPENVAIVWRRIIA